MDHDDDISLYISISYVSFIITWAKLSSGRVEVPCG
jgi:hypothetical protein